MNRFQIARSSQNGHNDENGVFKLIRLHENYCILIRIALIVPKGPMNNELGAERAT